MSLQHPGERRWGADCVCTREGHGQMAGGPQSFETRIKVSRRKKGLGNSRAPEQPSEQCVERDGDFSGRSFIVMDVIK